MRKQDRLRKSPQTKRVPLWKWLLIILLVLALPMYFLFYRDAQIVEVLQQSDQQNQTLNH